MNNTTSPCVKFTTAGFVSGWVSGVFATMPPLGLFLPGILFGVAISCAVDKSLMPLSFRQRTALVVSSITAYFVAIVVSPLPMSFPGFGNGFFSGGCSGAIAGGVGALIVAISLVVVVQVLRSISMVIVVSFAGALFGSLYVIVGVYISDHLDFEPLESIPWGFLVTFPLWQTGVASVIPLFRRRSK